MQTNAKTVFSVEMVNDFEKILRETCCDVMFFVFYYSHNVCVRHEGCLLCIDCMHVVGPCVHMEVRDVI